MPSCHAPSGMMASSYHCGIFLKERYQTANDDFLVERIDAGKDSYNT